MVIGDLHIPQRASEVHPKAKETLQPNQFPHVLCTGNVGGRQAYDWIKSLSANHYIVKGDFDEEGSDYPEERVIEIRGNKIGLIHGHQLAPWNDEEILANKARQMGVDIIISGHSHQMKLSKVDNITLLNPGSLTGAFSPLKTEIVASFLIIEFKPTSLVIYPYEISEDEIKPGENITINK